MNAIQDLRLPRLTHRYLLALIVVTCLYVLASCSTVGGVGKPAFAGSVQAGEPGNPPSLFVRYDGDTLIVVARVAMTAEVFQKATPTLPNGFPLFGPIQASAGTMLVHSRSRDLKLVLNPGDPLPAWVRETGIFRAGDAEAISLGFTFADEVTP